MAIAIPMRCIPLTMAIALDPCSRCNAIQGPSSNASGSRTVDGGEMTVPGQSLGQSVKPRVITTYAVPPVQLRNSVVSSFLKSIFMLVAYVSALVHAPAIS
jgi:hypothetical protein